MPNRNELRPRGTLKINEQLLLGKIDAALFANERIVLVKALTIGHGDCGHANCEDCAYRRLCK